MGAGQIGGIATLLDMDFHNAAGFVGTNADVMEAQYVTYFMSHMMLFCTGSLIEAHVVLTAASCIMGERYKFDVYGGTHKFMEMSGVSRTVEHICVHKGYNHSARWQDCAPDNLALLVLGEQFHFQRREPQTEFNLNRIRYGALSKQHARQDSSKHMQQCKFYGWGSRRNGYLVPLLVTLMRVDVTMVPQDQCLQMWNYGEKFICLEQLSCRSSKHGALCPDDLGATLECGGFLRGLMISRVIDRPCGVGFLDMNKYLKFLTCGVDDSRDIVGHNDMMEFEFEYTTLKHIPPPSLIVAEVESTTIERDLNDPGPPPAKTSEELQAEADAEPKSSTEHTETPTTPEENTK